MPSAANVGADPAGTASSAVSSHAAAADPHTGYVKKSGDTMTGQLTLPAAMPSDTQAARVDWVKQWDADHVAAADPHAGYVLANGARQMSGDLSINKAAPRLQLYHGGVGAVSLGINGTKGAVRNEPNTALTQLQVASPTANDDAATKAYVDSSAGSIADLAVSSGWADFGGVNAGVWATRVGRMVTIEGIIKRTGTLAMTAGSRYDLCVIPVGFRPAHELVAAGQRAIVGATPSRQACKIDVKTTGEVTVAVYENVSMAANDWVAFNVSFRAA